MIEVFVLLVCCYSVSVSAGDYDNPLTPEKWSQLAGTGFATNYFKTINYDKIVLEKNFKDVYDKGFRNLRLRCRTDLKGLDEKKFLNELELVVNKCLEVGVIPIVSWINHQAEAEGTEEQKQAYLIWWSKVAKKLKDKDYRLVFNLFTELGVEEKCVPKDSTRKRKRRGARPGEWVCGESINENPDKYKKWTQAVEKTIRNSGGKNKERILILASPQKLGGALKNIPPKLYAGDDYIMAEWHIYASGPNHKKKNSGIVSQKYWKGDGSYCGQNIVDKAFVEAMQWTEDTGIRTYFAAWMPQDNSKGEITQNEAIAFSKYFVHVLRDNDLPWSLNVLDVYYDTKAAEWIKVEQTIKGMTLDMAKVLEAIIEARDDKEEIKKTPPGKGETCKTEGGDEETKEEKIERLKKQKEEKKKQRRLEKEKQKAQRRSGRGEERKWERTKPDEALQGVFDELMDTFNEIDDILEKKLMSN